MQNICLLGLISVVLLGACATNVRVGPEETIKVGRYTVKVAGLDGFVMNAPTTLALPNPHAPNVFVTPANSIVVDQEPIRPTTFSGGVVTVTWALDRDSDYSFPDDTAISFPSGYNGAPSGAACAIPAASKKKKAIVCTYASDPDTKGQWKYSVTVQYKDGTKLKTLDPWIVQD